MARDPRSVKTKLDEALLKVLPEDGEVIGATSLGLSDWCDTTRIEIKLPDGSIQRFFEKRATGQIGFDLVQAHWNSETSVYRFIPEFVPRPVAWGTYEADPDMHFFLLEFVDMIADDIPRPEAYMAPPAALHIRSVGQSPTGKFGFPVTTRFGDLPQDNDWEASWEVWWTRHMRFVVEREEKIRGPHTPKHAEIKDEFLNKVLPRYLRPLETGGRTLQPTLCHADLWPGNVKYKLDNESVVVYDANALWAHSELELAPFRNPRYPLGKPFIKEYWKHVPISEPEEDADSRIIMYLIRNQVCLASLYPKEPKLREIFLNNMGFLVNRVAAEGVGANPGDVPHLFALPVEETAPSGSKALTATTIVKGGVVLNVYE